MCDSSGRGLWMCDKLFGLKLAGGEGGMGIRKGYQETVRLASGRTLR